MYALLVFTLGWPAPEPINTYPRIEVCQAVKMHMVSQLSEVEELSGIDTKEFRCVRMASLDQPDTRDDGLKKVRFTQ